MNVDKMIQRAREAVNRYHQTDESLFTETLIRLLVREMNKEKAKKAVTDYLKIKEN